MASPKISIAVRVRNEEAMLPYFLASLKKQLGVETAEIVFLDSGSTDNTRSLILDTQPSASVYTIEPTEFSFGETCNLMMRLTSAAHVLFFSGHVILSSQATLKDTIRHIEHLGNVSAYFRQIPCKVAGFSVYEQVFLSRAFPEMSAETPRIFKRFSNAGSVVSREHWNRIPFPPVIASEDGIWAARVAAAGLPVHYFSKISIEHSHNEPPQLVRKRVTINKLARYGPRPMPIRAAAAFVKYVALQTVYGENLGRAIRFAHAHGRAFM